MVRPDSTTMKLHITFYALLFSMLAVVSDAYLFGTRNYVRFRRPEDVWVPPFRTVLCDNNYPIRIQIDADPEEVCRNYMRRLERSSDTYDQ